MSEAKIKEIIRRLGELRNQKEGLENEELPKKRVEAAKEVSGNKKIDESGEEKLPTFIEATASILEDVFSKSDVEKKDSSEKSDKTAQGVVEELEDKIHEIDVEIEELKAELEAILRAMEEEAKKKSGNVKKSANVSENKSRASNQSNATGADEASGVEGESEDDQRSLKDEAKFESKTKPQQNSKSQEQKKPTEKGRFGGEMLTLKNLQTKLKELKNRQDKKEEIRGFSEGGSSVDEMDEESKDLEKQIAMIEVNIAKSQKKLALFDVQNVQNAVQGIISGAREAGIIDELENDDREQEGGKGNVLSFSSSREAEAVAELIADQYEALGFPTSISRATSGTKEVILVTVIISPEVEQGRNPAEMSAEEMFNSIQSIGERKGEKGQEIQKSSINKSQNNSQQQSGNQKSWSEQVGGSRAGLKLETGSWASRVGGSKLDSSSQASAAQTSGGASR